MASIDGERLLAVVSEHVGGGRVPGAVVGVVCGGQRFVGSVGAPAVDGAVPLAADAVFRISSLTKPLAAALTLMLVEDGELALDAPIERWIPELGGRRVLRRLDGPVEDTVPADRPITVDDLLTLRMGFGFVFDSPCPVFERAAAAGLGLGPPDPSVPLGPDAWVARFAELPLMHQPGAEWMYEFGYGVLGVLLARVGGQPLDRLLRERLLDPLGMVDTGFEVPAGARARLVTCYTPGDDGLEVFDGARDSRWHRRPAFPDARGGLVSTAPDYLRFARLLLDGGRYDGGRLLSERSVALMTTDRLGAGRARSRSEEAFLSAGAGWGYGVEVTPTRYGWGGGLGSTWYTYPGLDTAAVLLTQCLPPPEPLVGAFWSALGAMIGVRGRPAGT
ncbi:CubicO group peptidase (beta-lactamase class C family) [Kitasatospora sp. MAP12-15]|uniref:serine hydrolase domain-containing protein n=1 Tax=unclassified Kitasatospora TaxID=2633591 RepID=UPI002474F71C|nr:serine hydrolase domain-containing protein [Kitasatospora sp. MAP12-44]MDH6108800.1 CubicO group peptidase (beta-lactamase class C family) [Kitasatospora sp. MAP12-44]